MGKRLWARLLAFSWLSVACWWPLADSPAGAERGSAPRRRAPASRSYSAPAPASLREETSTPAQGSSGAGELGSIEKIWEGRPVPAPASPGGGPSKVGSLVLAGTPAPPRSSGASRSRSTPEAVPEAPAERDPFVDVVAVGRHGGWHCSGVLLSPRLVLTARHCLPATRVLAGADVESARVSAQVLRWLLPPERSVDAALLVLAGGGLPLEQPRLWRKVDAPPSGPVRVVGFGVVGDRRGYGEKTMGDLVADGWGCPRREALSSGCDPRTELVVRSTGGVDTCDGDSGGPLVELRDGGWQLLGITSRSVENARRPCGSGGVYTRIDFLRGWLAKVPRLLWPDRRNFKMGAGGKNEGRR